MDKLSMFVPTPTLDDLGGVIQKFVMIGLGSGTGERERLDRYTAMYALGFTACYFLTFIAYVPVFLIVCGAGFGVVYTLYASSQIAAAVARRQWRRMLSIAVPLISIAMLCGMRTPIAPRDKLWIAATLPFRWLYVQSAILDTPRFVAFSADCRGPRSGGFGLIPDCLSMVYDESDEIGLPGVQRSREWRTRNDSALATNSACAVCGASHVIGHFWVQYTL